MAKLKLWRRNRRVTNFLLKLLEVQLDDELPNNIFTNLHNYIYKGIDYEDTIQLIKYGAEIDIKLFNDTKKQSKISLKRMFITSEDKHIEEVSQKAFLNLQRKLENNYDFN